jgi:hypothetical protein
MSTAKAKADQEDADLSFSASKHLIKWMSREQAFH